MKRTIAIAGLFIALSWLAGSASASKLYGVEFDAPTPLYSVNQSTGALSAIGPTGFMNVADLTSDPFNDILWGNDIGTNQVPSNKLLKIDPVTGHATVVATMNSANPIVSLAFDPVTRTLFGTTTAGFGGATADVLYKIDPATGNTTSIGTVFSDGLHPQSLLNIFALGFDQHGTLFGVSDLTKQLISIDTSTAVGHVIADLPSTSEAFDIASRPEDNVMFLADTDTHSLYTIDTSTGILGSVGPYGHDINIVGLGFTAQVPEPSTYLALALGLCILAVARRRIAS